MTAPATAAPRDWRSRAACRDLDPDLFFPDGTSGPAAQQAQEALAACVPCPVRVPCLDWALRHSPDYGIWGATGPAERGAARRSLTRGAA